MKYEHIRGMDKEVSKIVCGCAILPMMKGEVVDDLLDQIYAMGVTTQSRGVEARSGSVA